MIDGDALTILAKHPELLENHHSSWILTPHHGEFKRFVDFKQTSEMVDQANAFAKKYHVTLVLKGPHTLISDGNETYRIMSGNKGMSSAGMGDTLAGIISSFLDKVICQKMRLF
ncbi:MAG: NAD(P)H-hydrate dehydratase [Faecalibacillus faecis]